LQRDLRIKDPFFSRKQMGGSLGGPIKKDKFFFFFNGEYNNQHSVVLVNNSHPIWSKLNGAFPQPLIFKTTNLKLDYKVNEKHNAFMRLSTDNNHNINSDGTTMPSQWIPTRNVSWQALGGVTSVFGGSMVNDLRYSHSFYSGRLRIPTTADCSDPVFCIGLGGPRTQTTAAPSFLIGNNVNVPQNRVLRTYQLTDTFSWQKGSHRLRFGGEWEHFYGVGSWAFLEPSLNVLWDPATILFLVSVSGAANSPVLPLYNALPASLKLNATGTGPLNSTIPTLADVNKLPIFTFLTGVGDSGQPQHFNLDTASHNNRIRVFGADQWRVSDRVTLNYGLAYSIETNILNHDLNRPAILAPLLGGDLSAPHRDKNNFDPSFGFAWDVKGNGKTVVRGGAGIYHDANLFWTRLNERAYVGPSGNGRSIIPASFYGLDFSRFNNPANPLDQTTLLGRILTNKVLTAEGLAAILPGLRAATLAQFGSGNDLAIRGIEVIKTTGNPAFGGIFSPDTVTPYSINASAGIQRELASNLVVTADFVMRRSLHFGGLHDTMIVDQNRYDRFIKQGTQFIRTPVIPVCVGAQALDPKAICSNGAIAVSHSGANYRYTGLHVKVDKRFSSRYLFVASYALSKFTGHNGFGNGVVDLNNYHAGDDYQPSDRRHRFTFSGFVDLPNYEGSNQFTRGVLNGWSLGLIMPWVSSPPLQNTIANADITGGINSIILPGGTYYGFGTRYGVTELRQFVNQYNATLAGTTDTRGQTLPVITLPTQIDNGDTFVSQDVRLTRNISITEKLKLQLIGEVFNVFNVSNLAGYSGILTASFYGQPTTRAGGTFGTGGPRSVQLAARLQF